MPQANVLQPEGTINNLLDNSTLGEIVNAWRKEPQSDSVLNTLDSRFSTRSDYLCWRYLGAAKIPRLGAPRTYLTNLRNSLCIVGNSDALQHGLDAGAKAILDDDPIIRVGGAAAICRFLLMTDGRIHCDSDLALARILPVVAQCRSATAGRRLPEAPAGSAYADLLSLHLLTKLQDQNGEKLDVNCAGEYLDSVESLVREIDPEWKPGASPNFKAIRGDHRIVLPFDGMTDVESVLADFFFQSRAVARDASDRADLNDPDSEDLIRRGKEHARSSWLTHRSLRFHAVAYSQRLADRGQPLHNWLSEEKRAVAIKKEMEALYRFGQAARDSGDSLTCAKVNWMILQFGAQLIRAARASSNGVGADWKMLDKKTVGLIRQSLEQTGFSIPLEYSRKQQKKPASPPPIVDRGTAEVSTMANSRRRRPVQAFADPYKRRLERDFKTDPRWRLLADALLVGDVVDPHRLLGDVRNDWLYRIKEEYIPKFSDSQMTPEVLHAAFQLCLEYDRIADANTFLKRTHHGRGTTSGNEKHGWNLTKEDLMSFARGVLRATAACPMALDFDTHVHWRDRLTRVWSVIGELAPEEVLLLHEAVLGCGAMLCSWSVVQESLLGQFICDDEPMFDLSDKATGVAWTPLTVQRLAENLSSLKISTLGSPVAVSLVALRERHFSIFVGTSHGRCDSDMLENIDVSVAKTSLDNELDFYGEDAGFAWSECAALVTIGQTILRLVDRLDPSAKWITLAVDPELASIPWNSVMRYLQRDILISVVPSLAWGHWEYNRHASGAEFNVSPRASLVKDMSADEENECDRLLKQLVEDKAGLRERSCSIAFVVGHGLPSSEASDRFWTVTGAAGPLSAAQWLDLSRRRRNIIVHGCLTGRVDETLIGDLSGVPGLALMSGTRLVISPVARVSANTATILQRNLTNAEGPGTIAERYLAAVCSRKEVCIYNLYGLPNGQI